MLTTDIVVKRYPKNPILTKNDVPYAVATVHNAGVVKHNGRVHHALSDPTSITGDQLSVEADSDDGFSFSVHPEPFPDTRDQRNFWGI